MPAVNCPVTGCDYTTDDVDNTVVVELLKLHALSHAPAPTHKPSNLKKPDRPEVDLGISDAQWSFFNNEWDIYKKRAGLEGDDLKLELRAACTVDLRRNLFDFIGEKGLSLCDEANLLKHIKQIAVEGKNPAVHRQEFYAITQSPDQPVTAFVGSLQAKAAHCCFNTKCECGKDASYTEDMVADQMIVGLYDKDVQAEVLSKDASLVSLKDKINYIGAIEEGKRATSSLGSSSVAANKSQYKSQQCYKPPLRHKIGHSTPKQSPKQGCSGCGSHDHGSGTDRPRAKYCPHWQSICSKCGRRGHVDTAPCRTVTPSSTGPEESNVGSFTSSLFTLGFSAIQPLESGDKMIPHMEWCDQMKRFVPQKPRNPKALMLSVKVIPEAHSAVECTLPLKCLKSLKTASVQFLADTGAQTCACDINVMRSLGLKAQDLLPTSHNLLGATKNRLNILGAALVEISRSTHESTRVMMYICSNISGAYLSESAQIDIGIIPQQFPHHTTLTSQCAAVSPEAIDKPSKKITNAISNFPVPKNITDARSWFGLVNQVAFSTAVAPFMQPFRDLLKDGKWYWDDNLTKLFEASRTAISQKIQDGVRTFEIDRPTCLSTDWSQQGIGFTLQQKFCICDIKAAPLCCPDGWKLVLAGSRFTSAAESRYAPVEGEALAVTYGLEKCRLYIAGCHDLIVAVDHAPLVKLLSDRHLNDIPNPRLLRLKEKTLNFTYNIKHVPGVKNKGPDALSRYPVAQPDEVSEIEARVIASISALTYHKDDSSPFISVTWERIEEASRSDGTIQKLTKYIINGFPATKQELPPTLHPFWDVRDHLTCIGDAVAYGSRIAVPVSLRSEVLDGLHGAHQGPKGMSARARLSVYWPGIDKAIAHRRQQCNNCNSIAPSQPSIPATLPVVPDYPFQFVVADYFDLVGRKFLVYADRYTGWVAVSEPLYDKSDSRSLMKSLREWFSIYGVPQEIATDGGQPFPSQAVQRFLKSWGVHHRLSAAYYPQSNGRAELAVKVTKRALMSSLNAAGRLDTDKVTAALLQYRNTPLQEIGHSPAQLLYGRVLRDHLPCPKELLLIRPEWKQALHDREIALAKRNVRNAQSYNLRKAARHLPQLHVGDCVLVQNQTGSHPTRWDKTGIIREQLNNYQYTVQVHGSGRLTLRNRRFLRRIDPVCPDLSPSIHRKVHSPALQPQAVSSPPYTEPLDVTMTTDDHENDTATAPQSDNVSSLPEGNLAASLPPDNTLTTPQPRPTVSGSAVRRSNRSNKGQPPEHLQDYICNALLGEGEM